MKPINQMLSKVFLCLLLIIPTVVLGQSASENVAFINPDFLKALLAKDSTIDSNGDLLIQKVEAEKVTKLDLRSCQLKNVQDITNFPNLKELLLNSNQLNELVVEDFKFLESLYCVDNQLSTLTLRNLPSLKGIYCGSNKLSAFEAINTPKLESLYLFHNNISEIDLKPFVALKYLHLEENSLKTIDISKNINLIQFNISENKIETIDITQNAKLNLKINYLDENVVVVGTAEQLEKFKSGPILTQGK